MSNDNHICFWCLQSMTPSDKLLTYQFNPYDLDCINHEIIIKFIRYTELGPFIGINILVNKNVTIHYNLDINEVSIWVVPIKNRGLIRPGYEKVAKLPIEFIIRDIPSIISKTNNLLAFL